VAHRTETIGRYAICMPKVDQNGGARPCGLDPHAKRSRESRDLGHPEGRRFVIRYGFNIRTKQGQRVENILIMAATLNDAERRLRQMYHHCEIVDRHEQSVPRRLDTLDVEAVIGLISAGSFSVQKAGTH
jgi:hypothetical protein